MESNPRSHGKYKERSFEFQKKRGVHLYTISDGMRCSNTNRRNKRDSKTTILQWNIIWYSLRLNLMLLRLYTSISRHKPTIKRREKHISHRTEAKSGTLPTVHQRDIIKAHIKVRCFMRYPKYQDQEEIHIMWLGNFLEFFFPKRVEEWDFTVFIPMIWNFGIQ